MMRPSLTRLISSSTKRLSLLGPPSSPPFPSLSSSPSSSSSSSSSSSTSCQTSKTSPNTTSAKLGPVRYHIFDTPLPYPIGLGLQNEIIERRLKRRERDGSTGIDVMLLLEHTPTYTTGRRDSSPNPDTLHPEEKKVQNVGADFYITKRGGQVTYHGPGQLVGYPLLDLNAMETPTRCYVEYLQALLADYARDDLGIPGVLAPHPDGHVGVFASPTEKFASIGIHLRHRITSHGFAMNITPTPIKWFDLILACGLADVKATSLHNLLSHSSSGSTISNLPSVRDVAEGLIPRFEESFSRRFVPLASSLEEVESGADDECQTLVEGDEEAVREIRELVEEAEESAKREMKERGGWRDEPDLSKRIL